MEKYAIVTRLDPVSEKLEEKAEKCLDEKGFRRDDEHPDVVIVIGGDGTFIYAVHQYMHMINDVCFFGIHTGTLGFYSDYLDSDIREFLNVLIENTGTLKEFQVLQAVTGKGKCFYGINEIRIENAARTQVLDVSIDDHMLETFRGSGMCVCTQLGSTAYNRSLGGAVIQEGLDLIELAEISGIHHSRYRSLDAPIVLKADSVIRFEASSFDEALLGTDSQVFPLDGETVVEISVCRDRKLRLLRGKEISYFDRLKSLF
ncbi:MAG: NAD(+)/NADH kinase [Bulleidia sp.]